MGDNTEISWADDTFNPWWGCHKVSDECTNCYAETHANRFHPGHWGLKSPRWSFGDKHWNEPKRWNAKAARDGKRRRVFCASMADVFELHPVDEIRRQQDDARDRLWSLIQDTPNLDWLLLTKRPENFYRYLPWMISGTHAAWRTVWLGVTAGVKKSLARVKILRDTPAWVRFVSCEPLLEHITPEDWREALEHHPRGAGDHLIDWLIVGDESGRQRRPAMTEWVRSARDAASEHAIAFHFKQWNGPSTPDIHGTRADLDNGAKGKIHLPILDGEQHAAFPEAV